MKEKPDSPIDHAPELSESRRSFLRTSALVIVGLPVVAALTKEAAAQAPADPALPVDEASPVAAALGYKHDTTKVDGAKFAKHKPEQLCSNCNFYRGPEVEVAGKEGKWGKCTIFPTNLVNANGWCTTWTAKTS